MSNMSYVGGMHDKSFSLLGHLGCFFNILHFFPCHFPKMSRQVLILSRFYRTDCLAYSVSIFLMLAINEMRNLNLGIVIIIHK